MKEAVLIFTRIPLPGQTKTRLMPYYTGAECAALHRCFLADIAGECRKTDCDLFIYYTGTSLKSFCHTMTLPRGSYCRQRGETLNERMYNAFQETFGKGYEKCILIGSDIPALSHHDLRRAFRKLDYCDIVLGPAYDGGYYLIGMKGPHKEVFAAEPGAGGSVLLSTMKRAHTGGFRTECIRRLPDIDTREDLERYKKHIYRCFPVSPERERLYNNRTGRWLRDKSRISVIIPVLNEEQTVQLIQEELGKMRGCEVIFADGGSTDRTLSLIDRRFHTVQCGKGRALQMNEGARASTGDILVFLHSDSLLPQDPSREIREALRKHRWGCFGISFQTDSRVMKICAEISNFRAAKRHILFGDQGIFIERSLFFEAGMFPALPIMEDYQFSLNIKEMKVTPGMTADRITTSARRYPASTAGRLHVMRQMYELRRAYRHGADIREIASKYKDVR